MSILNTIKALAEARKEAEQASTKRKAMLDAFKNSPEYLEVVDAETVDTKAVETAAKNGNIPADLVRVEEQPQVYIDSDLSQFLES